ncbi:MAG: mandelate racemase/muconate lactonizing enzyme family protein [Chloroflexi bacterium]|nr:mandelate racemase/muconate lactonizing enzyme family protein [Chloroflexota bacterium]
MKITDVQAFYLRGEIAKGFAWSLPLDYPRYRQATLVRVLTDEGIEGWGEAGGGLTSFNRTLVEQMLKPQILGEDPLNRERIWQKLYHGLVNPALYNGLPMQAMSGIDVAMWDIAGKAAGLPVHMLLGGALRERVMAYATGLYYVEGDDTAAVELVKEAEGYAAAGFRGMKMKIGRLGLEGDLRRVAAVRKAIGPDLKLMVDGNLAYNAYSAKDIGRRLEDYDVFWFEEPVPAHDLEAYLEVKAGLRMAIAGGECWYTRFGFRDFLARRAVDIAQPDISNAGGLTECQKIAAMANAFGIQVNLHVWGTAVATAASLHLAAALPLCHTMGRPGPYYQETVLEFDRTPHPIRDAIASPVFQQKDSYLEVPQGPGLGIEVDLKAVQRLAQE